MFIGSLAVLLQETHNLMIVMYRLVPPEMVFQAKFSALYTDSMSRPFDAGYWACVLFFFSVFSVSDTSCQALLFQLTLQLHLDPVFRFLEPDGLVEMCVYRDFLNF